MPSPAAKTTKTEPLARPVRPLSLAARSTLATALALAAFLGVVGLTFSKADEANRRNALQDRLQNFVLAYMAGTDIGRYAKLVPPDSPPDPQFARPGSGLYAAILGDKGARWVSASVASRDIGFMHPLGAGQTEFSGPVDTSLGRLYYFSYGVQWDVSDKKSVPLTFVVAQTEEQSRRGAAVYRASLFGWLSTLGLLLIVLQLVLLRWSLTPLRKVANDMSRVEQGESDQLDSQYPVELTGLTQRINAFIHNEREQRQRQRNTLADLAHSLKTPLAVIRSQLESADGNNALRDDVLAQVRRMDELVAYQLARAATTGRQMFATAIPIAGRAEDLVRSLEKVYAAKNVLCEFDIDEGAAFHGEQGDLMELLGNLLENAFKWARHHVLLVVRVRATAGYQRAGLWLSVEDDGPGIEDDQVEKILQRGVRGDERVQGHGIGLSIVQDIVRAYQGDLQVDHSPEFGGARFSVQLPAS